MSKSSDLGWCVYKAGSRATACASLRRRFQESRMPGNPLVRFDEGRVGRTPVSPSLLLYRETIEPS
jgi:hypothetical protein